MRRFSLVLACLQLFWAPISYAEEQSARMEQEVQHLLDYIEESGCTFIRNGISHQSDAARKHINRKYQHIRKDLSTAEDFIDHAASQSSITGSRYLVRCGGATLYSGDWLSQELWSYREKSR